MNLFRNSSWDPEKVVFGGFFHSRFCCGGDNLFSMDELCHGADSARETTTADQYG